MSVLVISQVSSNGMVTLLHMQVLVTSQAFSYAWYGHIFTHVMASPIMHF